VRKTHERPRLERRPARRARQKSAACSSTKLAIEDILDSGLPGANKPELYGQKCAALFEHVYQSYPERNAGVYAGAG